MRWVKWIACAVMLMLLASPVGAMGSQHRTAGRQHGTMRCWPVFVAGQSLFQCESVQLATARKVNHRHPRAGGHGRMPGGGR
jgi:hypothetical protein